MRLNLLKDIWFKLKKEFKNVKNNKELFIKNYIKRFSSGVIGVTLTFIFSILFIDIIGMSWKISYFLTAGITFNIAVLYEYLINYQRKD